MDTTETTIKLIPNNDTAKRFVAIMGDTVIRSDEDWGDGDIESQYEFVKDDGVSVAWCGDNSIGACVGAYMKGKNIIGLFNFGDDGDFGRVINDKDTFFTLGDL